MADLIIRRLSKADTADYRAIRLHGLLHDPVAFTGCYAEEVLWTDDRFADRLTETPDPSAIFGAFLSETETLVGIVGLHIAIPLKLRHKATLWGMYTLPSVRGMGVGRKLMNHLLAYAHSLPEVERILLIVTASNTAASGWYEQLGFRLYGIEQKAVKIGGVYEDDELRILEIDR